MNTRPHTQLCKKYQSSASIKISFLILSPASLCSQEIPTATEELPHRPSLIHHTFNLKGYWDLKSCQSVWPQVWEVQRRIVSHGLCNHHVQTFSLILKAQTLSAASLSYMTKASRIWPYGLSRPLLYNWRNFVSKPSSRHAWHFLSAAIKSETFPVIRGQEFCWNMNANRHFPIFSS